MPVSITKSLFTAVAITFLLILSPSTYALQPSEQDNTHHEKIDLLIEILDDKKTREALISELSDRKLSDKALTEDFSLSETLNIEAVSEDFFGQYKNSLAGLGISESMLGKLLLSLLSVIVLYIFLFINNRLAKKFDRKLSTFRQTFHLAEERFSLIFKSQRALGRLLALVMMLYTLSLLFPTIKNLILSLLYPQTLLPILSSTVLVIFFAVLGWELCNALLEYTTHRTASLSDSRVRTILPVIRNILFTVILLFIALVFLSELGIDIMPLLAGAGVAGVALGFGAQALVKDFLTGFIVILEDLFQVGDVIRISDRRGEVERITLRKVQLRDLDGTVHTIPFSDVSVIDNFTKVYSHYLFEIGVAYREDTDEVIRCLKEIDEEVRQSDDFKAHILEPLEVLGVDSFADSAVIIKARVKTTPRERWYVGREYNRRIKQHFDREGIEIPFPHQTIYFGEDKEGNSPSANIKLNRSKAVTAEDEKNPDVIRSES